MIKRMQKQISINIDILFNEEEKENFEMIMKHISPMVEMQRDNLKNPYMRQILEALNGKILENNL